MVKLKSELGRFENIVNFLVEKIETKYGHTDCHEFTLAPIDHNETSVLVIYRDKVFYDISCEGVKIVSGELYHEFAISERGTIPDSMKTSEIDKDAILWIAHRMPEEHFDAGAQFGYAENLEGGIIEIGEIGSWMT